MVKNLYQNGLFRKSISAFWENIPDPKRKRLHAYCSGILTFLKAMRKASNNNVMRFLVSEIFHKFWVPEVYYSNNRLQFVLKAFANMIQSYKIKDLKTIFYSSPVNPAERVSQSVLVAIRAYTYAGRSQRLDLIHFRNWICLTTFSRLSTEYKQLNCCQ